jgi:ADP-heptose:LPS heptosyltransferase
MIFGRQLFAVLRRKLRWHGNEFLIRRPQLLNFLGLAITVEDVFGTPGDTLLCGIICRELKRHYPRVRINCITPNPSLLDHDPDIEWLNAAPTFCSIKFWYLGLVERRDRVTNVLKPTLDTLGIHSYLYQSRIYLTREEIGHAKSMVAHLRQPIVSVNVMSRQKVKVWPVQNWRTVIAQLARIATVVQLGDDTEPELEGAIRLAGKLSLRESAAVLSQAQLHIGPDSFLMHAANGVGVPAVIIYGGSRPPGCLGYPANINLSVNIECSPCWLHDSRGDCCPYEIKCMQMITPEAVFAAVEEKLALSKA